MRLIATNSQIWLSSAWTNSGIPRLVRRPAHRRDGPRGACYTPWDFGGYGPPPPAHARAMGGGVVDWRGAVNYAAPPPPHVMPSARAIRPAAVTSCPGAPAPPSPAPAHLVKSIFCCCSAAGWSIWTRKVPSESSRRALYCGADGGGVRARRSRPPCFVITLTEFGTGTE